MHTALTVILYFLVNILFFYVVVLIEEIHLMVSYQDYSISFICMITERVLGLLTISGYSSHSVKQVYLSHAGENLSVRQWIVM